MHSGTPFSVAKAPNVILETIKRGEDDKDGKATTIILRLFEQYGGHANAVLKIASSLSVQKAELVNILEDNLKDLEVSNSKDGAQIKLPFRGYEIKTVRLTVKAAKKARSSSDGWVKI